MNVNVQALKLVGSSRLCLEVLQCPVLSLSTLVAIQVRKEKTDRVLFWFGILLW